MATVFVALFVLGWLGFFWEVDLDTGGAVVCGHLQKYLQNNRTGCKQADGGLDGPYV